MLLSLSGLLLAWTLLIVVGFSVVKRVESHFSEVEGFAHNTQICSFPNLSVLYVVIQLIVSCGFVSWVFTSELSSSLKGVSCHVLIYSDLQNICILMVSRNFVYFISTLYYD